jgi:2-polyprenyl-3-methyl-5-hydroxy-6-metoxy-1,4-benzoquinol methylase
MSDATGSGPEHRCPVCGSTTSLTWQGLYDDRYGYGGAFDVRTCHQCGHRYLATDMSDSEISELYRTRYPRSEIQLERRPSEPTATGWTSWLDGSRASAFRWVPPNVSVLDIGCGSCETLGYHESRGCHAVGVEADANVDKLARRWGFDVRIGLFDPATFVGERFDVVTLDQVIEHTTDPVAFLRGVHEVVRPGGNVIISTPNSAGLNARLFGRRWMHWHVPYHLQQFSHRSLATAAAAAGLEAVRIRTLTNSDWLRLQLLHTLTRPQPGARSALWDPGRAERPLGRMLRLGSRLIARSRVLHPAVRVIDALGAGDNYLAVLRRPA